MKLPNFLIIGAAKAGTTALYAALEQHPQVYMTPIKETNFFALEGDALEYAQGSVQGAYLARCITDLTTYHQQFQRVTTELAMGEAAPLYLYHPKAAERIQHYVPDVKLIAILRDPIDRAYSNFLHHIREDLEPCTDFMQAVQQEERYIANNWWWGFHYIQAGMYYEQLKRYCDRFDPEQIRIYLYEDLIRNQAETLRDIFQFLSVDSNFRPDMSTKQNVTGIPKNKWLHTFLNQTNPIKTLLKPLLPIHLRKRIVTNLKNQNLTKPRLSSEIRSELISVFQEDILKLQKLIRRDLSAWLR